MRTYQRFRSLVRNICLFWSLVILRFDELDRSYQLDMLHSIYCDHIVVKQLPHCEHSAPMECSMNPEDYSCQAPCAGWMPCCSKTCKASCYECQRENVQDGYVTRDKHVRHPCQKSLHCEHICQEACSESHNHTSRCLEPCRQECPHAKCKRPCSDPCAPCKEQCTW